MAPHSSGASVPPVRASAGSCGPAFGSSGGIAGEFGAEVAGDGSFRDGDGALGAAGG